ncbi:MAG: hypothetical protein Q8O16_04385 [Dehalococcoidia bacterium]|nr:hypothetical protein [Dehalococcoidia bacterium]
MNRISAALVCVLISAVFLISGCSRGFVQGDSGVLIAAPITSSTAKPTNGLVQSSEGGSVTIDVKWLGLRDNALIFDVSMDTHSVNLDVYDFKKQALLRDSEGKEYRATVWESPPGGHHREGTLGFEFNGTLAQGTAKTFELVIRGVAGVPERILSWRLN